MLPFPSDNAPGESWAMAAPYASSRAVSRSIRSARFGWSSSATRAANACTAAAVAASPPSRGAG